MCLINLYSKSFSKIGLGSFKPKNSNTYGCFTISLGLFKTCPSFDNSNTFSLFTLPSDNSNLSNSDVSSCLCNSLTDQFELIHSFS